jgi:hypothetical protein
MHFGEPGPKFSELASEELRARAAEYTAMAATARVREAAESLLRLAEQFEKLAKLREDGAMAPELRRPDPGS